MSSDIPEPEKSKPESDATAVADGAFNLAGALNDHKGKLAIGVAATLGLMVFYSWREKRLAKEDPEAHALHQRSKAIVKAAETKAGRLPDDAAAPADTQAAIPVQHGGEDTLPR